APVSPIVPALTFFQDGRTKTLSPGSKIPFPSEEEPSGTGSTLSAIGEADGTSERLVGSGQTNAPPPRGPGARAVEPRSICMSQIIALGSPLLKRYQTGVACVTSSVK